MLKIAVETANEAVSPMITRPRDSRRRCRDIEAATTPDSPPASGRVARARAGRPRLSTAVEIRHDSSAAPAHSARGARNVS